MQRVLSPLRQQAVFIFVHGWRQGPGLLLCFAGLSSSSSPPQQVGETGMLALSSNDTRDAYPTPVPGPTYLGPVQGCVSLSVSLSTDTNKGSQPYPERADQLLTQNLCGQSRPCGLWAEGLVQVGSCPAVEGGGCWPWRRKEAQSGSLQCPGCTAIGMSHSAVGLGSSCPGFLALLPRES